MSPKASNTEATLSGLSDGAFRLYAIPILMTIPITLLIFLSGQDAAMAAPAIELSPPEGPAGTMVTVTGSGFIPATPVTITFDGGNMDTRPETIGTNLMGNFSASFEVPHSIGSGTYVVVAKDHSLLRTSASATFHIPEPNNRPVADSQSLSIDMNEAVTISLSASDPDGDELSFLIVDSPQHGSISNFDAESGVLTFSPLNDYSGNDRFTYKVSDGEEESFLAEVSIRIMVSNSGPRMENMQVEVEEDTSIVITLSASDRDSSSLKFQIVSPPSQGKLGEIKPYDGSSSHVTYSPHPNFNGKDSFTVKASDTRYESEIAAVTISVLPVQDVPIAHDAQATIEQGQPLSVELTGTDPDGDALAYALESHPVHGTIIGSPPNLTYLPSDDYQGWDSFTFKVNDGTADSNIARIEIRVNGTASDGDNGQDSDGSSNGNDVGMAEPDPPEQESEAPEPVAEQELPAVENPGPVQEPPVDAPAEDIVSAPSTGSADVTPPRLILPASNLVYDSQSEAGLVVSYNIAAIDDVEGEIAPECSPASGTKFPIGKVNVICTASDASGNTILGSFILEVRLIPNTAAETNSFDLPNPDLQSLAMPSIIAGAAGAIIYAGVKAAKKARAKNSQPQRSV